MQTLGRSAGRAADRAALHALREAARAGLGLLLGLSLAVAEHQAHAHLMPDGHGTLNVQGGAAFVAVSLPVSWLGAVDDDLDGHLSPGELQRHHAEILRTLSAGLAVSNGGRVQALRDVLLSTSAAHDRADGAGTHLLVMGAAPLAQPAGAVGLRLRLQGSAARLNVTATRDPQKEQGTLAGPQGSALFFAPWWARLYEALRIGER